MKHKLAYFILLVIFIFFGKMFSGIFEDDEFDEKYFFIKSSPTWRWHFYSPRGMSDLKLEAMSEEQREDQLIDIFPN